MIFSHLLIGVLLAAAPAAETGIGLRESSRSSLVIVQKGDLPILLTASHGGREKVPGVPVRKAKHPPGGDPNTLEITLELARAIEAKLGAKPFVVAARFHRKYIDANREPAKAYEVAAAATHYDAYHAEIAACIAQIRGRWRDRGLLIDIHGNSDFRGFLRGTDNGGTMPRVIARHGEEGLTGPNSIFGAMAAAGHKVYPPAGASIGDSRERPRYDGGYTCRKYGGAGEAGIDAIQIECGEEIWTGWRRHPQFVDDLAVAVANYYRTYQLSRVAHR